jgi:hypothetical protein
VSHRDASEHSVAASRLFDGPPRADGVPGVTAHRLLSGESVVCVRSYVVFQQD